MIPDTTENATLIRAFEEAGQGGVFRFLAGLPAAGQERLLADARRVDLDLLATLVGSLDEGEAAPPEIAPLAAVRPDDPNRAEAIEAGEDLLAAGRVGFYTVAGGQGTRLGYDGPKGCFPIGPLNDATLFSWHAAKVASASRRYGREFPWVLMVSDANHDETVRHFEASDWYGLAGQVRFVTQRMLPAVDEDGSILLRSADRIALSPNGHGGSIEALGRLGTIEWLRELGVDTISYFQVDNATIDAADPAFLGYHRIRAAQVSAKVVPKSHPLEKAGVVATVNGRPGVVEYTEIPDDLARATDDDGKLLYDLANIAAHVFDLDFIDGLRDCGLPYHVAMKKVPTLDAGGAAIEVWGRKFETFVFDAIPLADGFVAFLTERDEEFAPLKNAEGNDSPESVRRALTERAERWQAGLRAEPGTACDRATFEDGRKRSG